MPLLDAQMGSAYTPANGNSRAWPEELNVVCTCRRYVFMQSCSGMPWSVSLCWISCSRACSLPCLHCSLLRKKEASCCWSDLENPRDPLRSAASHVTHSVLRGHRTHGRQTAGSTDIGMSWFQACAPAAVVWKESGPPPECSSSPSLDDKDLGLEQSR